MILTTIQDSVMSVGGDSVSSDAAMDSLRMAMQTFSDAGEQLAGGMLAIGMGLIIVLALVFGAIGILMLVSLWKIFTKAGEPGWAILIPIYNTIVLLKIAGRPWWWLFILPLIIPAIIVIIDLAKSFGKSTGFAMGMLFLGIFFYPILAFGSSKYVGPGGKPAQA